jgi:hypothetical protein
MFIRPPASGGAAHTFSTPILASNDVSLALGVTLVVYRPTRITARQKLAVLDKQQTNTQTNDNITLQTPTYPG